MFLYPWGDFHSLNLGWFLLQFKDWTEKIQEYLDNGGGTSENLANVIAPVFNAANTYAAGDYVLYNNELYKANQAVNPGTWDPEEWTQTLLAEDVETGGGGTAGVDNVARLMIAGQYSPSFAYQKYGICRYNDKLWMANTDLPAGGEAWNAAHWDEISVGAGLTGLRISVDNLANAIAINESITKRNFILIGDSFASGITSADGSTYVRGKGWADYAFSKLTSMGHKVFPDLDIFTASPGGTGFTSSYPWLQMLKDIKTQFTYNNDEITDIIVYGGTNDAGASAAAIEAAISDFCEYAYGEYPNATVRIGIVGTATEDLINTGKAYASCRKYGAVYEGDCLNLMVKPSYRIFDNVHLTQAGYDYYSPIIFQQVLTGNTYYNESVAYNLSLVPAQAVQTSLPQLICHHEPNKTYAWLDSTIRAPSTFYDLSAITTQYSAHAIYTIERKPFIPEFNAKIWGRNCFRDNGVWEGYWQMYIRDTSIYLLCTVRNTSLASDTDGFSMPGITEREYLTTLNF